MTYAGERTILDADSHVMELADFLDDFIDPDARDRLRRQGIDALRPVLEDAQYKAQRRRSDPAVAAQAEEHLLDDKGWMAMGGFDPAERSRALDLLGFEGQLVFATFATAMFSLPKSPRRYDDAAELNRDLDLLYAGCRAQNRAMVNFCEVDHRLFAVGYVSLVDPARAVEVATEAIADGCTAIMVPSTAAGDRAPTHPDLDPFWALLEQREYSLCSPCRRRRPPARPCVPQQRHAGHRSPRRWGEHPLQGLPGDLPVAVALPRRVDPRRSLRPLPRPARRLYRTRGRLGRVVDAPLGLRPEGVPAHRRPASAPRKPSLRNTCTGISSSRRFRASRWVG